MKEIQLNTGHPSRKNYMKYVALVDDEDYDGAICYNWTVLKLKTNIYARTVINNKTTYLHTFIVGVKGIDHKDNNGLNCQRYNLRKCTQSENMGNRNNHKKYRGTRLFIYKGIFYKWVAAIAHKHIGIYNTEEDAARAYDRMAKIRYGEFARLNFPDNI